MPQKKGKDELHEIEIHMDFAFMGNENEPGKTLTLLVVKERRQGS